MIPRFFQRVSESPTNPTCQPVAKAFDIADLYRGPATVAAAEAPSTAPGRKLRQLYFWIVNNAVISPFYDIEYNEGPNQTYTFGDTHSVVTLPSGQSYCSFILSCRF